MSVSNRWIGDNMDEKYKCVGCINGLCEITVHETVMIPHVCPFFSGRCVMKAEFISTTPEEVARKKRLANWATQ